MKKSRGKGSAGGGSAFWSGAVGGKGMPLLLLIIACLVAGFCFARVVDKW
jgi:hypothetical protein